MSVMYVHTYVHTLLLNKKMANIKLYTFTVSIDKLATMDDDFMMSGATRI